MYKADDCRARAQQFSELAEQARSPEDRKRFLRMKRSYSLLAKIAEWSLAMEEFLRR